ncbi:MAG TPA: Ig-like domain-containing protein, partial [Algoriphagus sp.]|nr:Ig-like domain-containing protein [Algoriphagus sp.]
MENSTQSKEGWLRNIPSVKKRLLVLTLFSILCFTQFGFATDYYISSSSGNDSRSASEAQNSATPWKTIDKLNSVSSILKGGDRILFKAGDEFYGTIKITKSGSAGAPILFTSYGTGNKPVITSLVKVSNLVSIGSGKYEADLSAFNLSKVQIVTINDQIKEVGRFPNTSAANGGYLQIANVNSSTSISTLTSNPYSGTTGDVVIRKNNWIIDRHAISNISGTSISFKSNESHYSPLKNYGYFLQNHASLLDLPGEWSYDPASKKLTVNLSGYNMTTVNVSVATLDNLVTNNQYTTNLSFSNLHFKGSNSHLLNVSRSQNIKIENSLLEYAGENAISAFDITGFLIQNNQINYALNSGIYISYGAPGAIIRGNTITNTFAFQGMAKNSDLAGIGIFIASDSDGSLIEKNNLINSGFNGIHFGGSYTKVLNNFINNFCLYKQDGGGIYTNSDGFRDRNNVGREIIGNIVINGKGTKLGTTEEVDMAEGIYLDDNSAGVKVSKNTIAFVTGKSIYLHNANNIEISDNLFFKSKSQVQLTHDFMGDPIRNVTVTRNQFSSFEKTHQIYSVYSALNDIGSVGSFTSNYFLDPFKNDFFIHTKGSSDGAVGVSRNLSNWATNFGYDANSLKPDLNIPTFKITSSTLIKQSDFSSNTSIVAGVYGATSQLVSSGISGGTLKLVPNSTNNATAYIQIGAIQTGQKILIEFDMKGTPANIPVELFLEGTFNIDKGSSNGIVSTTSSTKNHQILLSSLTTKSNESIVLRFPPALSELLLDNIKISKVTTEELDKESLVYFDYNATGTAVQKPLDGTYVNAKNETFSGSITIPSYGSVLLAKVSGTTTPVPNQSPTISITNPTAGQVFINGVDPVQLVANAQDPEGKIKQVEFYNGTTLLTTVTAAPYSYNWTNIQNGNYTVSAKVIDQEGASATSSSVSFTVNSSNQAPTVSLSNPTAGQVFINGVNPVQLVANAQDPEGKIKQVEFYNGTTLLTTVTTAPYSYN